MKPLPLPLRVVAGVAVTAAEQARDLPTKLAGLPVTVASQALQLSMRVQQRVTELAIKGDDALAALRPVEDTPGWATFDEDTYADVEGPPDRYDEPEFAAPFSTDNGDGSALVVEPLPVTDEPGEAADMDEPADPWALEQRALAQEHAEGEFDSAPVQPGDGHPEPPAATKQATGPAGMSGYDEMTLPQLRARLRKFSLEQLQEILDYERAHEDRPSFIGMLSRRINNVRNQQ
ncbi:MAG: lipid droplet-associated protein [Pseudonocardiaceae bacterium]|nr:lipid droplet-associated protein [Pseudonocardiaceae bacterium]